MPGDLISLKEIGKGYSSVLWMTWDDSERSVQETKFWPMIVGEITKDEIAIVLEIYYPKVGSQGAKICTSKNLIGWINSEYLRVIIKKPDLFI
jgi:hypothetical protein